MYTHSQFRNIPKLRKLMPQNSFTINGKTAAKYDLEDGEIVIVETPTGRLAGPLKFTPDLIEDVIQTGLKRIRICFRGDRDLLAQFNRGCKVSFHRF